MENKGNNEARYIYGNYLNLCQRGYKNILIFILISVTSYCYSQQNHNLEDIKKTTPFIFNLCENRKMFNMYADGFFDTVMISCNNKEAINVFEQRLNVLEIYIISGYKSDLFQFAMNAILNFELLTGIESQSDADYIGKYKPTEIDVVMWSLWLLDYKDYLCWYEEKNILYLSKECPLSYPRWHEILKE